MSQRNFYNDMYLHYLGRYRKVKQSLRRYSYEYFYVRDRMRYFHKKVWGVAFPATI